MRVPALRLPRFTSAFKSWLTRAFEFMKEPLRRTERESVIQVTHVRVIHTRIVRLALLLPLMKVILYTYLV